MLQFALFFLISLSALKEDNASAAELPKSTEDGLSRMEQLLGRYDPKDSRQFRIALDQQIKNQPEPDKPALLHVVKGVTIVGTPFRSGDSIAFDIVEDSRRQIYELGEGGKREFDPEATALLDHSLCPPHRRGGAVECRCDGY